MATQWLTVWEEITSTHNTRQIFVIFDFYHTVWLEGEIGDFSTYSQFVVPKITYSSGASASQNPIVSSPMPGKVIKIAVKQGQEVKVGDTLVIVEAMKMEHSIVAPCDG
jgi:acetyl/propionyl-CoA carboxylase alpha subunit